MGTYHPHYGLVDTLAQATIPKLHRRRTSKSEKSALATDSPMNAKVICPQLARFAQRGCQTCEDSWVAKSTSAMQNRLRDGRGESLVVDSHTRATVPVFSSPLRCTFSAKLHAFHDIPVPAPRSLTSPDRASLPDAFRRRGGRLGDRAWLCKRDEHAPFSSEQGGRVCDLGVAAGGRLPSQGRPPHGRLVQRMVERHGHRDNRIVPVEGSAGPLARLAGPPATLLVCQLIRGPMGHGGRRATKAGGRVSHSLQSRTIPNMLFSIASCSRRASAPLRAALHGTITCCADNTNKHPTPRSSESLKSPAYRIRPPLHCVSSGWDSGHHTP
jgi:hypothetical protein